jgi:GNAT superfamily N-acetyltransferase
MALSWEFIQATSADAEHIAQLVNSAYRGESSKKGWTTEADLLGGQRIDVARVQEMLSAEDSVILVAENEATGVVEGCVHLENHEGRCYLGMLTVLPTLQGKGLGGQLLEEAEAFADFWGCKEIYMTVIEQRKELLEWYQGRGYKLSGETKPFPTDDPRFGIPKVEGLQFVILTKNF